MTLNEYRAIAAALDADIVAALAKHGLNVRSGQIGASIDPQTGAVTLRIKAADANFKDSDGNATSPEAELFKKIAPAVGISATALGKTILLNGRPFTIEGWRDTRGRKPVVIKRVLDGKIFVTTIESVKVKLAGERGPGTLKLAKSA